MKHSLRALAFALFLLTLALGSGAAQPPVQPTVDITQPPAAAQPSAHFDPDAATEAYLATMPAAARARSDAYFEGGYWLILWDFLLASGISLLLLFFGWSAGMRRRAERVTRLRWLRDALYWAQYLGLTYALTFPLNYYEGFVREHAYGLGTQSFGAWLADEAKGLAINLVLTGIALILLFAIVRKFQRTWWIWGSLGTFCMMVLGIAIAPVFLQPVFNKVTLLSDPKVTAPVLRLAHGNGIATDSVYQIDASRQTNRMSANVSGFGSTMRITLNDNLLRRGSVEEIQAVTGHEMGHYVLNHIPKSITFFFIVIVASFAYLRWTLDWSLSRWGARWGIQGIGDTAVLPLVMLLSGVLFFVLTPILNTQIRTQEKEADMYGINASRQPDGFAQAAIHLGEYRKMRPGPIEEWIFFDHPSGYDRIHSAMVWKANNLELFQPGPQTAAEKP